MCEYNIKLLLSTNIRIEICPSFTTHGPVAGYLNLRVQRSTRDGASIFIFVTILPVFAAKNVPINLIDFEQNLLYKNF
jgi:hypothetical protein